MLGTVMSQKGEVMGHTRWHATQTWTMTRSDKGIGSTTEARVSERLQTTFRHAEQRSKEV